MVPKRGARCPLCGLAARILHSPHLRINRVECPQCRTYHITLGLMRMLAEGDAAVQAAPLLSAANRRVASHGRHLEFTEGNFIRLADAEERRQSRSALLPAGASLAATAVTSSGPRAG